MHCVGCEQLARDWCVILAVKWAEEEVLMVCGLVVVIMVVFWMVVAGGPHIDRQILLLQVNCDHAIQPWSLNSNHTCTVTVHVNLFLWNILTCFCFCRICVQYLI